MAQRYKAIQLKGGLNYATAPLFVPAGETLLSTNYAPWINGGYRRTGGYERFDGRPSPSAGADAAAVTSRRAAIGVVPGSGPVRGVCVFLGEVYAWRDNAGGTATVMHKATSSGWTAVSLTSYIPYATATGEIFDGDAIGNSATPTKTATVLRVMNYGGWTGSGAGRLYISTSSGAWAATDPIYVGATQKATASGGVTTQTLSPGGYYETIQSNFYGSSDTFRLYGCDGVNRAFEFDGTNYYSIVTGMATDTPTHICEHLNYLWLSYPGGGLQSSSAGSPNTWSVLTGASQIGLGASVTGLYSIKNVLVAHGLDRLSLLYGTEPASFELKPFDKSGGAFANSVQNIGGDLIGLDDKGLMMLSATQNYGDFAGLSVSEKVKPLIEQNLPTAPRFSLFSKRLGLYMLFWQDQTSLLMCAVGGQNLGFGTGIYPADFRCGFAGEDGTGQERIFVGANDGFVYEMEVGTSFDGAAIESILRLAFHDLGSPDRNKRLHRLQLEIQSPRSLTFQVQPDFDYGTQAAAIVSNMTVVGSGGIFDLSLWDDFEWDGGVVGKSTVFLDGVGTNFGFLIYQSSADYGEFTVAAAHIFYSFRGQSRG